MWVASVTKTTRTIIERTWKIWDEKKKIICSSKEISLHILGNKSRSWLRAEPAIKIEWLEYTMKPWYSAGKIMSIGYRASSVWHFYWSLYKIELNRLNKYISNNKICSHWLYTERIIWTSSNDTFFIKLI